MKIKAKPLKVNLKEVSTFLDVPYSTLAKWDKRKKEALRYGVAVIKQIQAKGLSGEL